MNSIYQLALVLFAARCRLAKLAMTLIPDATNQMGSFEMGLPPLAWIIRSCWLE